MNLIIIDIYFIDHTIFVRTIVEKKLNLIIEKMLNKTKYGKQTYQIYWK